MKTYGKTCAGCIYDGMAKCPIMKSKPRERFCHRTKEEQEKLSEDAERYGWKHRK